MVCQAILERFSARLIELLYACVCYVQNLETLTYRVGNDRP